MTEAEGVIQPKEDPTAFELRAAAPRPVRIRRGALIGLSASALALVSGAVAIALRSPTPIARIEDDQSRPADARAANEALASAPSSYAKVPVLGPPLTGIDMLTGKPGQASAPSATAAADASTGAPGYPASTEPKGADVRRSAILVSLGSPPPSAQAASDANLASTAPSSPMSASPPALEAASAGLPANDPNHQDHKATFVHAGSTADGVNPHILTPAASPWIVSAGSIIAASLITGLNSDLPGEVSAQVTENVYDSPTGRTLLIPQGTRLIGANDNSVSFGQKRALIVWRRLILPDGASIQLDNWPAADKAGYTGLTDTVDGHSWQLIKGVALSTLLGVGTELSYGSSDSDLARALRQSVETGTDRAGEQLVGKSLDVQPTIRVRPGWPVRVVVHQDLVLQPWHEPTGGNP